jgi:hypothetical protein
MGVKSKQLLAILVETLLLITTSIHTTGAGLMLCRLHSGHALQFFTFFLSVYCVFLSVEQPSLLETLEDISSL